MQDDVDLVMAAGVEPKQLDVQRVRKPSQRMPIVKIGMQQRPLDHRQIQHLNVGVVRDVAVVVEVDERIAVHRVVKRDGRHQEQQAEKQHLISRRTEAVPRWYLLFSLLASRSQRLSPVAEEYKPLGFFRRGKISADSTGSVARC